MRLINKNTDSHPASASASSGRSLPAVQALGRNPVPAAACEIQIVRTEAEFDSLQADWQRLSACLETPTIFNGWHWNRLWWNHYKHLGELYILVVRANNKVCAIAPFYIARTRWIKLVHARTLRFIGSGSDTTPDDLDVLIDTNCSELAVEAICTKLLNNPELQRYQLIDMPEDSIFQQAMLRNMEFKFGRKINYRIEHRRVTPLPVTFAEYTKTLSRNHRKQIKRRRSRLAAAGDVRFDICRTHEDVDRAHRELVRLHQLRWSSKLDSNEQGSFRSESYIQFHLDLMHALLARNELQLVTLFIDDAAIAVEYAFLFGGVLVFFQTGFDPDHAKLSPGHMLMNHMIETAIADGVRSMDLLKGDYAYKSSYADHWRRSVSVDQWVSAPMQWMFQISNAVRGIA